MSLQLLETVQWRGVAMVEWKMDLRTGKPMLMEINRRFWGSLELAVRSGVDFPMLYAHASVGYAAPEPTPVLGLRCRWLIPGDVLRRLTSEKAARESLRSFWAGLPYSAEEWDRKDLRGFVASIFCQGLAVIRPKYRKMLRR